MQLKSAKLKDGQLEVSYSERLQDGTMKKTSEGYTRKAHPDLEQAFKNLRVHFGLLCGFINIKSVKKIETPPEDLIEGIHIGAIHIKTGDDEGVTITGYCINPLTKKAVNTNTPFQRYSESEESAYKFIDDLIEKVERAAKEIEAYLDGSKVAADPQGNLFEGEQKPSVNTAGADELPWEEVKEGATTEEQIAQRLEDKSIWADGVRPEAGQPA